MSTVPTSIPLSLLQLKHHFFSALEVRANAKGSNKVEPILQPVLTYHPVPSSTTQWSLGLQLFLRSVSPENPFIYEGEIHIHGVVEVHESVPADRREKLAVVNGLSMLYSAVREMLLTMTSRCAHGGVSLPTLNFSELVAQLAATAPSTPP